MSTPETPSTRQWWLLQTIANRSSGEPVDDPHLPERLRAVEALREGPGREGPELLLVAGGGQGGVADVVVEVEVRVVDPDRAALVERDEPQLLAEAGDEVQPRFEVVAELVEVRRRAVEDHRRGDVHVGSVALQVEEGRVEAGQAIETHAYIFSPP